MSKLIKHKKERFIDGTETKSTLEKGHSKFDSGKKKLQGFSAGEKDNGEDNGNDSLTPAKEKIEKKESSKDSKPATPPDITKSHSSSSDTYTKSGFREDDYEGYLSEKRISGYQGFAENISNEHSVSTYFSETPDISDSFIIDSEADEKTAKQPDRGNSVDNKSYSKGNRQDLSYGQYQENAAYPQNKKTPSHSFISTENKKEMPGKSEDNKWGFRTGRTVSEGFQTVKKSYDKSKRYISGAGRFTGSFVKSDDSDEKKQHDSADQTIAAGRASIKVINNTGKFLARQLANVIKLVFSLLTGGTFLAASGCLLPALFIFAGILFIILVVVAVIIIGIVLVVNLVIMIIDSMFASDIGGCEMYAYAYDRAVSFQTACNEALEDADTINVFIDGDEIEISESQEIKIDYAEVFIMYLGMNDTAWYADPQLNLMPDSDESCLQQLLIDTRENREKFDDLFDEMYVIEASWISSEAEESASRS